MSLGDTLRKIREQHGLTQEQFADKVGVKRTTYISYENSKTNPDFEFVRKVVDIFDVSILDFLEEEAETKTNVLRSSPAIYDSGLKRDDTPLSSEEKLLVEYYRSLDDKEKTVFYEQVKNDFLDKICGFPSE